MADSKKNSASDMAKWSEILLLAAREMGVTTSSELVRAASVWAKDENRDQAILDITLASGLSGTFVEVDTQTLSPALLPFVLEIDTDIGLVTAFDDEHVQVHLIVNGASFQRQFVREKLFGVRQRVLLLGRNETVRDDRLDRHLDIRPESWFHGIFTSNLPILAQLGLGSLFGNLMAIGTSLFAMLVWDRVVPARSTTTLWVLVSGVATAMILEFIMRMARSSITDHFGKLADLKLSSMFFMRVLNIRNDARPRSPGTLISQLRDLDQMRELLTSSTLGVLLDLPFVLAFLLIIGLIGGKLVFVPVFAIPLIILPGLLAQFPLGKLANAGMEEGALRNAVLMESIYRAEDIKLLQAEPRFRKVWNEVNKTAGNISLKQRKLAAMLMYFSQMVQQLAYVGVVVAGVYGMLASDLTMGAVLACSILTSRTIAPLAQIPAVLGRLQSARVGKKALDGLLKLPLDHERGKDYYHKPVVLGKYDLDNVVYSYGPFEKPALIVPRLKIAAGEKIAILGRVGAGKSTLLRMLAGLSAPVNGQIMLDGTPIGLVDIADIRRDVGAMFQESSLFYGTLRDNLLIGNPLATDEEILTALRLAVADKLLLNQPHGLDLKLRESGLGLSGGQKQSMMLSRLFLRSPNVVILDEPTASLDEASEMEVLKNMQGWLGNRTLIVATHRYQVLSMVDRILVVDNGRVIRDGPKDEVLKNITQNSQPVAQKREKRVVSVTSAAIS